MQVVFGLCYDLNNFEIVLQTNISLTTNGKTGKMKSQRIGLSIVFVLITLRYIIS